MRVLLVAGLAACGAHPPPPLQGSASAAAAPASPPPAIRWEGERGFAVAGLPAIAGDGSVIVLGIRGEDGGRGNPNLAIVVRDRQDRTMHAQVVLAADEADAMYDDRGASPALAARITAGNRRLAELHRAHDLHPLAELVMPTRMPDGRLLEEAATGRGLHVEWQPSHLRVVQEGRSAADRPTPASWLAPPRAGCTNEAFLAGVWADPARRAAVLAIRYTGTDLCWEPDHQAHVVAW